MNELCILDSSTLDTQYDTEALAKAASAFIAVPVRYGELYCNMLADAKVVGEKFARFATVDPERIVVSYDCMRMEVSDDDVKIFASMDVLRTPLGNIFKNLQRFTVEFHPRILKMNDVIGIVAIDVTFIRKPGT